MRNSPPDGAEERCAEHQIRVRCPALKIPNKWHRQHEKKHSCKLGEVFICRLAVLTNELEISECTLLIGPRPTK